MIPGISTTVQVIVGGCLLVLGRKLFWLFVGAIGFAGGMAVAPMVFEDRPEAVLLVIAVGCGLIGAILAILAQKIAVGLAGFVAGGLLSVHIVEVAVGSPDSFPWVVFVVGGAAGALLVAVLFDWALIALSSLIGAFLITQIVAPREELLLLIVLSGVGMAVQARMLRRRDHDKR